MSFKSASSALPPAEVVVTNAYGARFFYGSKNEKRICGNFAIFEWAGVGDSADGKFLPQVYSLGKPDRICPALGPSEDQAIKVPDDHPFVLSDANDAALRGPGLWCFTERPWEKGYISESSNFNYLWASMPEAGYCDLPGGDRSLVLDKEGNRYIDLMHLFGGLHMRVVSIEKKPSDSKDKKYQSKRDKQYIYVADKCIGWAEDLDKIAAESAGRQFRPHMEHLVVKAVSGETKPIPAGYAALRERIITSMGDWPEGVSPQDVLTAMPDEDVFPHWMEANATVDDNDHIIGLK